MHGSERKYTKQEQDHIDRLGRQMMAEEQALIGAMSTGNKSIIQERYNDLKHTIVHMNHALEQTSNQ